jgi:hypothetical protein
VAAAITEVSGWHGLKAERAQPVEATGHPVRPNRTGRGDDRNAVTGNRQTREAQLGSHGAVAWLRVL